MIKTIKVTVLLAAATMAALPASAQNDDLWVYETKQVIDTVKADSLCAVKNIDAEIALIDQLIEKEESRTKEILSGRTTVMYDPMLRIKLAEFANDERVTKKDLKAIQNFYVPKGFTKRILQPTKDSLLAQKENLEPRFDVKYYYWRKEDYRHARQERISTLEYLHQLTNLPKKSVQVPKPNPECRDNYFNGQFGLEKYDSDSEYRRHKWDKSQQSTGWEWANIDSMEYKSTSYPEKLSWHEHPNHPGYRFMRCGLLGGSGEAYNAYNSNGELVRVDNICGRRNYSEIEKRVMTAICRRDFLANKYDINKSEEKTLNALRSRLGVKKSDKALKAEAEVAKGLSDAIVKGEVAKFEKDQAVTKKEYEKAAKEERDAENAAAVYMLASLASVLDKQADNYIEQLRSDHSNDLKYLYKIERIDNTTFKIYYLNDKFECGCIALMKWFNKDAYESEFEIELLPCETITIRR